MHHSRLDVSTAFGAFLVSLAIASAGCPQQGRSVGDRLSGGPTPAPAPTSPDQTGGDRGGDGQESSTSSSEGESDSKLKLRTLEPKTGVAERALERNFRGFLERERLGFDATFVDRLRDNGEAFAEELLALPETLRQMNASDVLQAGLPAVLFALFIALFFVLARQLGAIAHRLQSELQIEFSRWATRILRGLVLVAGRVASVAVLVGLSYFPIHAIFGEQLWTRALTTGLWHLLVYRLVSGVVIAGLGGRLVEVTDEHAERLARIGIDGARVVVGFLYVIRVLELAGLADPYLAFATFCFRVSLIAFPVYLWLHRNAVLDLLPHEVDSSIYVFFRDALDRNFRTVMAVTAGLLVFRAAGYVNASTFLLVRGYGLAAVYALTFALYGNLRDLLEDRVTVGLEGRDDTPLEGPEPGRVARRLEQLLTIALVFGLVTVTLELLLLREPAIILLQIPFLVIGEAEVSLMTLLNIGLIIFGTVLATKLLRALLNSHLYPLFDVDIGVAYAINTLTKYVVVVASFFIGLATLGVDLTAITVVAASLGVGIGFGLQTIVENLISGFIILFGQSVQKGDYITVDGTYGQVDAVGARSVIITTPDNFEMLIPCKEIVGGRIINWSYDDNTVRARLEVGVSYESEPQRVREILLSTCKSHDHVLEEPKPSVRLIEFNDSSIDFELLFFFDCRETTEGKVIGELNFEVWKALETAGVTIPFPQRDLHVKSEEDWEEITAIADRRDEELPGTAGDSD